MALGSELTFQEHLEVAGGCALAVYDAQISPKRQHLRFVTDTQEGKHLEVGTKRSLPGRLVEPRSGT